MEKVSLEYADRVAILKFADPGVMNAIGAQMLEELTEAVGDIQRSDARALLLTGEGRGFCAGANLTDERRSSSGAGAGLRAGYHPLLLTLKNLKMPMVSAVNGAAAGVGMSFAMMADLVCASKKGFFLQAFARIGLVPDGGATFLLPRLVGWGRAVELSMLAERLSAEQAFEWGLVNRLYDDNDSLLDGALQLADKLSKGPAGLHMIRQLYWSTWSNSYEQQLEMEAQLQEVAGSTDDFREGTAAFREKRDARFEGR